jgi:hypothetical protein
MACDQAHNDLLMIVRVVIPNVASGKLGVANSTAIHEKYSSLTASCCTVLSLI